MQVTAYQITIRLFDAYSLKDKRSVIKSLSHKIHNKFNVSIAEVDKHDLHNLSIIAIAIVSNDYTYNNQTLDSITNFIENNFQVEILFIEES